MTALALPTSPLPASASPRPIIFGGWLTPTGGGDEQFLARLGSRWALDVVTPNLKPEPDGRLWASVLTDAWFNGTTVLYPWPEPGLVLPPSGLPVVDGRVVNGGTTLQVTGKSGAYVPPVGKAFSVIHAGRRYLHRVKAVALLDAVTMSLQVAPMLRVAMASGDVCEFDKPMIEGKVSGNAKSWTLIPARVQSLSFSIEEIA
ncbi:MAG: hypothetical protein ACRYG4_26170 [Janthinobacterium lividum]